jgi:superfamily II DNA or RNA helicase
VTSSFAGWAVVAQRLVEMASPAFPHSSLLNDGQRASLNAIAARIGRHGVVIADEVGMGKTRIAAFVANAVVASGGRCAAVIPPGLGFQWQAEFRECGTNVVPVIRSLQSFYEAWNEEVDAAPWFRQPVVLVSHRFSDWRLGPNPQAWRWWLVPELYAAARQMKTGRYPRLHRETAGENSGRAMVRRVAATAKSIVQGLPSAARHPGQRLLSTLLETVPWPTPLDPELYGRGQKLRSWLERGVGLGLGVFDLIIVDEAHKSRGDDSGLARVLSNVVLSAADCRRIALTATPIELDVKQWSSTLGRIGLGAGDMEGIMASTKVYAEAIRLLRLGWRMSPEVRDAYVTAARDFEAALSPYLIRRDKREDQDVVAFQRASGLHFHDYRRQQEISVELSDLSTAWRQAVCAAEALSVIKAPTIDTKTKRLRLTIGNGHGIASVIDESFKDERADQKQQALDEETAVLRSETTAAANERSVWWAGKLRGALAGDREVLFDHPGILAAIRSIEVEIERGEKVLVFGRFTRPLRTFVSLLNARQMFMRIAEGHPWPQRKVHGERDGRFGDSEWPAVLAAHRQLASSVDLDALDELLSERYRRDAEVRAKLRDTLVGRIRAGLSGIKDAARYFSILGVIEQQALPAADDPEDDDRHLTLLARAVTANLDSAEPSDADMAAAFIALVNAASDIDNPENEPADEDAAAVAWRDLEEHLRDGYSSRQGGFARLMYGDTKPQARRMMQLAFNRKNSFPRVLVAQSLVGREGLNLHEACRIVVLLHPEWNPGVVEQQIGRVDRVNSRWAKELNSAIRDGKSGADLPRIEVRPVIFKGTYDEHNWSVLLGRWDDLRAQLHGEAIPARLRMAEDDEGRRLLDELAAARPEFSPLRR